MRNVIIEKDECIGCETCVELCPNTFFFDRDSEKAGVKDVIQDDEACIEEAIASCPVDCINWE